MNTLLKRTNKRKTNLHAGLTLVELLIAMSLSTVVVLGAANLVIESMQSRASAEELRRKQQACSIEAMMNGGECEACQ